MAITMRKGAYADFDPSKMKAGEWAVSTDTDSNKQQVWMCFSPGVVKRMGTVEDFDMEIQILIRQYLDSIAESVEKAQESAELATSKAQESADSADKAKASEDKAKEYEESAHSTITVINEAAEATRLNKEAAAQAEANAKASENQALSYKNSASASEQASKASETNAKTYADNASASATSASTSASEASESKTSASTSASRAKTSESNAKTSETNSAKSESEAQKYAEQAKEISESLSGALRPLGTINFADLPSTAGASSGDMYNITDQFTTTTDFKEGAGNTIPAGSNVYLTADRYWDVLAGTPVTGVKGTKEVYYRRGNVDITPANIGAVAEDGDTSNTTVTFADTTTRENLVSGEKVSVGFGKIKKWFADLKSFAFKDLVNNLTTTTAGSALDASQGKILNDKYDELNQSLKLLQSHVGMIIQSTTLDTEAKVIAIYGGTKWTKIEGRFLLGASSSYKINTSGGEATHKLTVNEMPSHTHSGKQLLLIADPTYAQLKQPVASGTSAIGGYTTDFNNNTGGNVAHNNMPPYKVVYIWERTA